MVKVIVGALVGLVVLVLGLYAGACWLAGHNVFTDGWWEKLK